MDQTRYSWSGKNVGELASLIRSRGFEAKESKLPKPEFKIAFRDRIEVVGEKCKVFLDPYTARFTCEGEPSEKDRDLESLIREMYPHRYSFETAIIYPAILALALAAVLSYVR